MVPVRLARRRIGDPSNGSAPKIPRQRYAHQEPYCTAPLTKVVIASSTSLDSIIPSINRQNGQEPYLRNLVASPSLVYCLASCWPLRWSLVSYWVVVLHDTSLKAFVDSCLFVVC